MPTRSQVLGYLQDIREATPQDPVTNVQIADYLEALLNLVVADGVTKTTPLPYGSAKGLEIWATGGTAFGLPNEFVEASVKSKNIGGGNPEVEFWNTFTGAKFSFKDTAAKTERFRIQSGSATLYGGNYNLESASGKGLFFYNASDAGRAGFVTITGDGDFTNRFVNVGAVSTAYGVKFLNGLTEFGRFMPGGNFIIGSGADNGLAKLQTPNISLGTDIWQYSSEGEARLNFTSPGFSYYRVPDAGGHFFRHGTKDTHRINKDTFGQFQDAISDFVQTSYSTPYTVATRSWVHRKEASGTDYRFFDYDGATARDWWSVAAAAATLKMTVAQVMYLNYGSNVGIGTSTPNAAAILDLNSTTKGLLLPRVTTTQRNAIPAPVVGLLVCNISTNKLNFYNGSAWEAVTSA